MQPGLNETLNLPLPGYNANQLCQNRVTDRDTPFLYNGFDDVVQLLGSVLADGGSQL